MGARVPEARAVIVGLSAPFGWSGLPSYCSIFGRAIPWIIGQSSPATVSESTDDEAFFGYEWVDDHVKIEVEVANRLQLAEATLRHAMLAIIGPRSINEKKFS